MPAPLFSFEQINLSNVRLSFPKLIKPEPSSPTAKPTFGCDFILAPNDPQLAHFMEQVAACAFEKWKEKANFVLQMMQSDRKLRCYGNGNEKVKVATLQPHEGYVGMFYISASSSADRPPSIARPEDGVLIDNTNTMERTAAADKLYGGCYVNAIVGLWAQDNQHGKAVRCNLHGLQFLRNGDPLGSSGPDISKAFQPVPGAQQQPSQAMPGMPWSQQAPQAPQAPWTPGVPPPWMNQS